MDITYYRKKEFEERESRLKNAMFQELVKTNEEKKILDIVYVMTWTSLCGGSKIILEHANYLVRRGHKITIISHFPKPDWFKMDNKINFIQVPWEKVLCEVIHKCDVIVATYWREIYECIEQKKAPVVYFEQGDAHIFDQRSLDKRTLDYIKMQFKVVPFIYTVSTFAKDKIKEIYNRDSHVIPNAVNDEDFYPNKNKERESKELTLAMIGSENSEFKGINRILGAICELRRQGFSIRVNWITPDEPKVSKEKCFINKNSKEVGEILRNSDVFICASKYESFGLPILEAMKCGLAIITTDTGGNRDFIKDNENALITNGTVEDIVSKVKMIINDRKLENKLKQNALIISENYKWNLVIDKLEIYYKEIAKYKVSTGE